MQSFFHLWILINSIQVVSLYVLYAHGVLWVVVRGFPSWNGIRSCSLLFLGYECGRNHTTGRFLIANRPNLSLCNCPMLM